MLGILIFAIPDVSVVTFALLFGIGLVVHGAFAPVEAFRLRRLRELATTRGRPTSTARPAGS